MKGGFLTFWAILAHSVPRRPRGTVDENEEFCGIYIFVPWEWGKKISWGPWCPLIILYLNFLSVPIANHNCKCTQQICWPSVVPAIENMAVVYCWQKNVQHTQLSEKFKELLGWPVNSIQNSLLRWIGTKE